MKAQSRQNSSRDGQRRCSRHRKESCRNHSRNNGFHVVNLGIKVPPEQLIKAVREHNPISSDFRTAGQIRATDGADGGGFFPSRSADANSRRRRALTSNFVDNQIAKVYTGTVAYASDANERLGLAKTIVDPGKFERLKESLAQRRARMPRKQSPRLRRSRSSRESALKQLPYSIRFRQLRIWIATSCATPIDRFGNSFNPLMLYGRHLGFRVGLCAT